MTSFQKCYFRCSRPPDVDGIKTFDKDEHVAKHCSFIILMFYDLQLVILIKNFDPINIKRLRALEITVFCSDVIMNKAVIPIKNMRPWLPIWFHSTNQDLLVLGHSFLYLGCLCLNFTSFYKIVYPSYEKIKCSQLLNHCSLLHQFYSELEILYSGKLLKVYIVSGKVLRP